MTWMTTASEAAPERDTWIIYRQQLLLLSILIGARPPQNVYVLEESDLLAKLSPWNVILEFLSFSENSGCVDTAKKRVRLNMEMARKISVRNPWNLPQEIRKLRKRSWASREDALRAFRMKYYCKMPWDWEPQRNHDNVVKGTLSKGWGGKEALSSPVFIMSIFHIWQWEFFPILDYIGDQLMVLEGARSVSDKSINCWCALRLLLHLPMEMVSGRSRNYWDQVKMHLT